MKIHLLAVVIAFSSICVSSSSAATVYVTPKLISFLNPDFTAVDPSLVTGAGRLEGVAGRTYFARVDVTMRIDGLGGNSLGFSNTAFNAQVNGNGFVHFDEPNGVPAWNASNPQLDSNGPDVVGGEVGKWDINADEGLWKNDVQSVILAGVTRGFGPQEFDARRTLGQGEGELAGTMYVRFPCMPGQSTNLQIITPWGASTYDADGVSTTLGNVAIGGDTGSFGCVVPEPSSALLAGMAATLLGALRLRAGRPRNVNRAE